MMVRQQKREKKIQHCRASSFARMWMGDGGCKKWKSNNKKQSNRKKEMYTYTIQVFSGFCHSLKTDVMVIFACRINDSNWLCTQLEHFFVSKWFLSISPYFQRSAVWSTQYLSTALRKSYGIHMECKCFHQFKFMDKYQRNLCLLRKSKWILNLKSFVNIVLYFGRKHVNSICRAAFTYRLIGSFFQRERTIQKTAKKFNQDTILMMKFKFFQRVCSFSSG